MVVKQLHSLKWRRRSEGKYVCSGSITIN